MVTSESTVLITIRIVAITGRPTRAKLLIEGAGARELIIRPATTNTITGTSIVPIAPIGSRRKILVSIHVSFSSPRSIVTLPIRELNARSA